MIVVLLSALYVCIGAYQIVPASVLPLIRQSLKIGAADASWVVSILFLSMAIVALPVGILTDRVNNRRFLGAGIVIFLAATVWGWNAGATRNYEMLIASRFLGGIACTVIWTTSVNLCGFLFHDNRETIAIGILAASPLLGFAVGQVSGPQIAAYFGWTITPLIFGVGGVVVFVIYWLFSDATENVSAGGDTPTIDEFIFVIGNHRVWLIASLSFISFSVHLFINNWIPSFMVDQLSVSVAVSGALTAVFPLVGILGRISSGPVSNRIFDARRKPIFLSSMLVMIPTIALIWLLGFGPAMGLSFLLAGFFSQFGLVILFTYVREVVPVNVAGTSLAVLNTVGFLGAFSAPTITGFLIEKSGGYLFGFVYVELLLSVGILLTWIAPETKP